MRYYKWCGYGFFIQTMEHQLLLEIELFNDRDLFNFIEIDSICQTFNCCIMAEKYCEYGLKHQSINQSISQKNLNNSFESCL